MANPLQAFVLTFALEGDEIVSKGLKRLTKESGELENATDEAGKSVDNLGNAAQKSAKNFMLLASKVAAVAGPLIVLKNAFNFATQGEEILFMAQSANIAADSFQRLANASKMFGGWPESAAGVLRGLNTQIQNMKFGQGSAVQEAAIRYGVSLHGANGLASPEELLENIARRMETLDPVAQWDVSRMIGLDDATIRLLQGGVAGLRKEMELASKYTVFSKEDLENAWRFERTLREVKMAFDALWAEVSRSLLPILQEVGETGIKVINYFREHADFIKGGLLAISAILAGIAVKSVIAFAPFYGVAALVAGIAAAFVLLYDDFMTWAKGGESALGFLWSILVEIGKLFQDMPDWLKDALSYLLEMTNPLKMLQNTAEAIGKILGFKPSPQLEDIAGPDFLSLAKKRLSEIDFNPLNSIGKGDILSSVDNSSRNVTVENNFTINGADSPMETASQVQRDINPIFQLVSGRL